MAASEWNFRLFLGQKPRSAPEALAKTQNREESSAIEQKSCPAPGEESGKRKGEQEAQAVARD
ncbi:hypothetical protein, partial [Klebsiella pneumoniae]|uniref:hypothetical protein n=1 Tax=Klebsiella pneumoniae TaxID=573 RepID=UPI001D119D45